MRNISTKKVKARKEHECGFFSEIFQYGDEYQVAEAKKNGCDGTIKKGDVYEQQVNVDNGDIWTYRTYLKCKELPFIEEYYEE